MIPQTETRVWHPSVRCTVNTKFTLEISKSPRKTSRKWSHHTPAPQRTTTSDLNSVSGQTSGPTAGAAQSSGCGCDDGVWWACRIRQPAASVLLSVTNRPYSLNLSQKAWAGSRVRSSSEVSRQQPSSSGINATMLLSQLLQQRSPNSLHDSVHVFSFSTLPPAEHGANEAPHRRGCRTSPTCREDDFSESSAMFPQRM